MDQELNRLMEAASNKEVVEYRICALKETTLGENNTPALVLGIKCKDSEGVEIKEWLNHVIWGSVKSQFFRDKFTDVLGISKIIFSDDGWQYEEAELKGYEGKCQLAINERGYVAVKEFFKKASDEPEDMVLDEKIFDEDVIPF